MDGWVLRSRGLAKAYGGRVIFADVSLDVMPGVCAAFVGHNGTGKTTLLKVLAGLVMPTAGTVERAGEPTIGYIPEQLPRLLVTVSQYLGDIGRIGGMRGRDADARRDALLAAFFMSPMTSTPMAHLSKGSLQKVAVIQALMQPRDVLLLDEPLSGQDHDSQEVFLRCIEACKQAGSAVLLSCHEPGLIRRLADAVYELRDAALHPVALSDPRFAPHDLLVFGQGTHAGPMPERLLRYVVPGADDIRLRMPAGESNAAVVAMIGAGYPLEAFAHEGE